MTPAREGEMAGRETEDCIVGVGSTDTHTGATASPDASARGDDEGGAALDGEPKRLGRVAGCGMRGRGVGSIDAAAEWSSMQPTSFEFKAK